MSEWIDSVAVMSPGYDVLNNYVPNMVQATVGYFAEFVGNAPPVGSIIKCRIQVRPGRAISGGVPLSLGVYRQPWFELTSDPPQCFLQAPNTNAVEVTHDPAALCSALPQSPLKNGAVINLNTRVVADTYVFSFAFNIRITAPVAPRQATLAGYVQSAFGELGPVLNLRGTDKGPLLVVREPGPTSKIEVMTLDGGALTYRTVVEEGLVGDPRWIREHSQIVYSSYASGLSQLYVIDASGRAPHRLTPSGPLSTMTCGGAREYESNLILLHAIAPGERSWSIWQVASDGSNQKRLTPNDGANYLYPSRGLLGFRCIRHAALLPGLPSGQVYSIAEFDFNGTLHCQFLVDSAHRFANLSSPLGETLASAHVADPINSTDSSQHQIVLTTYYDDVPRTPPWLPPNPIPDNHRFAMPVVSFQGNSPAFSNDGRWIAYVRGGTLFKRHRDGSNETAIGSGFLDGAAVCWSEY